MLAKNSVLCIGILTIELSFYLQSIYNLNRKRRLTWYVMSSSSPVILQQMNENESIETKKNQRP